MLPVQLQVQVQEQSQEVPVGVDGPLLDDLLDGPAQRQAVVEHEVRQHQGGGPAQSHDAVHQNLGCGEKKPRYVCECALSSTREWVTHVP